MLRTDQTVFLGVVVNPKTKSPVHVTRRADRERTVDIWIVTLGAGARHYAVVGEAYLEEVNSDFDYRAASLVTGFPRSHSPAALYKGQQLGLIGKGDGYGTCLYTGLTLLATAANDDDLHVPNLLGAGPAICSDEESRSAEASRWWYKARTLGLVYQERGTAETDEEQDEEEVLEDEDLTDYMSRMSARRLYEAVAEAVDGHSEWGVRRVTSVRGDVYRSIPVSGQKDIIADVYTYEAATDHNLVAVRDVEIGTPITWAKSGNEALEVYKDVILALNVANEDALMAGKLARLAQEAGATEREVAAMMMRNRFGVDTWRARPVFDDEIAVPDVGVAATERRKIPPPTESTRERALDMMARAGTARVSNPQRLPLPRRNPPPTPTAADRRAIEAGIAELDKRRDDLGWNHTEELP